MDSSDTVIVIGGSSGLGLAVARQCLAAGASVVIAGRSADRLKAAEAELAETGLTEAEPTETGLTAADPAETGLTAADSAETGLTAADSAETGPAEAKLAGAGLAGAGIAEHGIAEHGIAGAGRLRAVVADIGDRAEVAALFERAGSVRHLVVTAGDLPYGPVRELTEDDMMRALRSKFLGPYFAVQEAARRMTTGGSITFISGIAAYRPAPGGSLAAAVNGALESMVRAFALELAPVRVNAVSPGWVDTPVWDKLAPPDVRRARQAEMAARLPGGRLAEPADVARAVGFLMEDDFVTGTVLHAEGGQLLA